MALFGTDGIRGIANRDLTADLALRLGRAAVAVLGGEGRPTLVIGRDTRASGEMLQAALAAGVCSAGGDVLLVGVVPTPAVAFLTTDLEASAGVVISASHNPPDHNGIKFFSGNGMKLPDDTEAEMERLVQRDQAGGTAMGRVEEAPQAADRYLVHLVGAAEADLAGMRLVVDCANGAAFRLAPQLLSRLGAEVFAINDEPDGSNINVGSGAMSPEVLAEAVRKIGADGGVAHDGDADRAIFADAEGNVVDGDQVLAASALAMSEDGSLAGNVVVTTVMANLGFRKAMEDAGISVAQTKVGDRYVLEEMERRRANLGGEQSGHIIFRDQATTGDGLLTAVRFFSLAARTKRSVAQLAACMQRFPQVLLGVEVEDRDALEGADPVWEAVRSAETALEGRGRVLVRPSGTEALVRVMVEAETEEEAHKHAEAIADSVRSALD